MIKNSKYRNTGIIYELLVHQICTNIMENKDSPAIDIVKNYFTKSELAKEHKIYQALIKSKIINETKAEVLISTMLEGATRLSKQKLKSEKYNLIAEIKKHYNLEEFFKAKINNYAQYAAIYNLIESKTTDYSVDFNAVVDNKITILEHITQKDVDKDKVEDDILEEYLALDDSSRMIAYKLFLERFNTKYSVLSVQQRSILKEYINNVSNTVKLKDFINTKLREVKKTLVEAVVNITDKTQQIKLAEVITLIQPLDAKTGVKDEHVLNLLQYFELIDELKKK